jgi:hypothetical protein
MTSILRGINQQRYIVILITTKRLTTSTCRNTIFLSASVEPTKVPEAIWNKQPQSATRGANSKNDTTRYYLAVFHLSAPSV